MSCPVQHTNPSTSSPSSSSSPVNQAQISSPDNKTSSQCPANHQNIPSCPVLHSQPSTSKESIFLGHSVNQQNTPQTQGCNSTTLQTNNTKSGDALPTADQHIPLLNQGIASTIPRADSDNTYVYPSPQRFYNAMKRKGWSPKEQDMEMAVSIHNTINEECWKRVLEYEKFHENSCSQPKLFHFEGRPNDPSPKAKIKSWIGYSKPFDRHDWTVDRCGKKVHYIIDFYEGKPDPHKPLSVYLDVRPSLTLQGGIDRLRMWLQNR